METLRPLPLQDVEGVGERQPFLVLLLFLLDEQVTEVDLFVLGLGFVQLGGVLDGRTDQPPPRLEARLAGRGERGFQLWVAQQDGVQRLQDLGPVVIGPADRVWMVEVPVFRVGAIDDDADVETA